MSVESGRGSESPVLVLDGSSVVVSLMKDDGEMPRLATESV